MYFSEQIRFFVNDFIFDVEDNGDSREVIQLRILYDARGKRIEKMTREIEALKQDTEREKRILSHQLAMAEGNADC